MKLIRVDLLRHIEDYSRKRAENIKNKILQSGVWEKPICVDKNHFLVMDGQHRMEAAIALKLKYVPCEMFDYNQEDLEVWTLREDYEVTKQLIIKRALSEDIYPYKTAKHKFPRKIRKSPIFLDQLKEYSDKYSDDIVNCQ